MPTKNTNSKNKTKNTLSAFSFSRLLPFAFFEERKKAVLLAFLIHSKTWDVKTYITFKQTFYEY